MAKKAGNKIIAIGIKNLKRRLALAYPNNHSLIFTTTDSVYNVQLQLQQ